VFLLLRIYADAYLYIRIYDFVRCLYSFNVSIGRIRYGAVINDDCWLPGDNEYIAI
jgi:hypothetical protein